MGRHARRYDIIGGLAAVAIAGLAVYVGGGWGILAVEALAGLIVVVLYLRSMNEEGDGDDAG